MTWSAEAQESIQVVAEEPRNEFPAGVTFTISFTAPGEPKEVRLRYELAPDGTGASGVAECTQGATHNCAFTLTSGRGIFVIPGAEITYHWEIRDAGGDVTETEERLYVHEDTRFDFRTLTDGSVTVYYHVGTEEQAPAVLQAAVEALADVGDLAQTTVGFPVKVFLYETATEMQPAIAPSGGRGVQILGEVVYSDTAMVSADVDVLDITRHEIAHIVTREATRGPFGIADWMNEGISVYAQRAPLPGQAAALEVAIRGDRALTMSDLNSSATGGVASTVSLYYAQSGDIVRFLVETYGREKFAELLRVFKDGATPDDAYERVYGFDELGLENAWRASVGLAPRAARATPTPDATQEARSNPTRSDGAGGDGAAAGDDDSDGLSVGLIAVFAALAVAVVAAGVVTVRVVRGRL